MAKQRNIFDLSGVDPVREVSKHLNKKGKLKGSKKEVKNLRSICMHHAINRKGKIKPRITSDEGGHGKNCRCTICQDRFRTGFYNDQEVNERYRNFKQVASQLKFMLVAEGANKEAVREAAELNLHVDRLPKIYRNARTIADKQGKKRKKKRNK